MSGPTCSCGCRTTTPVRIWNRPGLPAVAYRTGTHGQFLDTMLARLSDAQHQPLAGLTHRRPDDPSIALLDGWAVIADILTFYQERIANEGYLATATEADSLTRLGRLVGHRPRPALAAGTFLAYTLDPGTRATIPAGSQVKSTPAPGALPQTFETSEAVEARAAWNRLPVRRTVPPDLTPQAAATAPSVELSGIHPGLRPGDRLLLGFAATGEGQVRTVHSIKPDPAGNRTTVAFTSPDLVSEYAAAFDDLKSAIEDADGKRPRGPVPRLHSDDSPQPAPSDGPGTPGGPGEADHPETPDTSDTPDTPDTPGLPQPPDSEAPTVIHPIPPPPADHAPPADTPEPPDPVEPPGPPEPPGPAGFAAPGAPPPDDSGTAADPDTEHFDALRQAVLGRNLAVVPTPVPDLFLGQLAEPINRIREQMVIARAGRRREITDWLEPVAEAADRVRAVAARATGSPDLLSLRQLIDGPLGLSMGSSQSAARNGALLSLTPALAALNRPPSRPPADPRDITTPVATLFGAASDTLPRLLAATRPQLAGQLYQAMSTASVGGPDALTGIQWFRVKATPCGAALAPRAGDPPKEPLSHADDGDPRQLTLDAVYDAILPGSWIAVQKGLEAPFLRQVTDVAQPVVVDQDVAFKLTRLTLSDDLPQEYRTADARRLITVWAAGEPLPPAGTPLLDDIAGRELVLENTCEGLRPGRWLIVSGERTDVPGTTGVQGTELVMLAGVRQDAGTPGDRLVTTLVLTTELAYTYRRETAAIHGNVVPATAGETCREVLGSGDAAQAGQAFVLRRPPLTFLPAPTPGGATDTLTVRIAGVTWPSCADLSDLGPTDPGYHLRTGPDGTTCVRFGNGTHGMRLPTGQENVTAEYRMGGGSAGNVPADRINQVVSRPLGVSAVTNPLSATGGTDADDAGAIRTRVPLRLRALDRLVSLRDYEDFALAFAGIGKASARHLTDGTGRIVHVTVAAVHDAPLDPGSPLTAALRTALQQYGEPALPLRVDLRERVLLALSAGVRVLPDHTWETVEPAVRRALQDALGFTAAELGRPVHVSAAIAAAQAVPGVDHVSVDVFGGIPDDIDTVTLSLLAHRLTTVAGWVPAEPARYATSRHTVALTDTLTTVALRHGLTLDQLVALNPGVRPGMGTTDLGGELVVRRGVRAAQLVVLDPAVPETLVLRRIP
ncbi:putative baseplate assembly protein [Streptomyces klenkii]|uniref:Putative baseplate assembly protein n=1 Tax=Streptomyces klenkii TaxID=1420899 RepID=A0A3B0BWB9_9ACTN|nr:putative baseplate assembly protein [Streptomyces klenkii]RKN77280.1 putative baseplate assembly protein [Streptomyces klenkii]